MKNLAIISIIGLAALVLPSLFFYCYVGMDASFSNQGADWSEFGSYFGGLGGPLLAFLSVILLVYTIQQQTQAALKIDMLRYVSSAGQEIDDWLKTDIASSSRDGEAVNIGLIVWGVVSPNCVNPKELGICLERLLKLTCSYCSAIALYEANVDPYFIYKQHYAKASELIKFLQKHQDMLGQMSGPSLGACEHLLNEANSA